MQTLTSPNTVTNNTIFTARSELVTDFHRELCVTRICRSYFSGNLILQLCCPKLHSGCNEEKNAWHMRIWHWETKHDPDVNKEEGKSPSAHHKIGGRPVRVCQPDAHSQEIVPLFNGHFSAVYWPRDYTDHCITFHILFMNLLIFPMK
jgi:hypothetical protein